MIKLMVYDRTYTANLNSERKITMKKALSLVLALVMCFSCCMISLAADSPVLRFDENGEFKILHITDCQDKYPMHTETKQFIQHCLDKYDPDLVVLGGDNTVPEAADIEKAIEELATIFVDNQTYFTLVFGNHDREGERGSNEKLLGLYQKYGKSYCLAYDAVPSLSGVGTHRLPIFSSKNALKVAYNLYMFDSGTSGYKDANGNEGYECVYPDQIEWFKATNKTETALNGGTVIPSMAFQHIIVGEIMDVFYKEKSEVLLSLDSKFCNGKEYDLTVADFSAIEDGILTEPPCPGVENFGQFDALVEQGTVAVFSGHDHVNTFTVNHKGVDIVNTPGCTYNSYGNIYDRGARLITLTEGTTEYGSEVLLLAEEAMDSEVIELDIFSKLFGVLLNRIILAFFDLF